MIVGAGAGGGVVAKELAAAGLSVVLLERGKWYSAADCRKDDLHNQRTTVLGNGFGPDDERNPRVVVDERGEHDRRPQRSAYSNNAACVGGGTFSYGAMAWRYMEKDFRMRSTYGAVAGSTLEDWPIGYARPGALLRKGRMGDGRLGRRFRQHLQGAAPQAAAHAAACAHHRSTRSCSRPPSVWACIRSTFPCCATRVPYNGRAIVHALPLVRGFRLRS